MDLNAVVDVLGYAVAALAGAMVVIIWSINRKVSVETMSTAPPMPMKPKPYDERLKDMTIVDLKAEWKRVYGLLSLGGSKRNGLTQSARADLNEKAACIERLLLDVPIVCGLQPPIPWPTPGPPMPAKFQIGQPVMVDNKQGKLLELTILSRSYYPPKSMWFYAFEGETRGYGEDLIQPSPNYVRVASQAGDSWVAVNDSKSMLC